MFLSYIFLIVSTIHKTLTIHLLIRQIVTYQFRPFSLLSISLYRTLRHPDRENECKTLIEGHICLSSHLSEMISVPCLSFSHQTDTDELDWTHHRQQVSKCAGVNQFDTPWGTALILYFYLLLFHTSNNLHFTDDDWAHARLK